MNTCSFRQDGTVEVHIKGGYTALVDLPDLSIVYRFHWVANKRGGNVYAYARDKNLGKLICMHRLLTNCPLGMVVDHLNRDTLDNRRLNMRVCYQHENSQNNNKKKACR